MPCTCYGYPEPEDHNGVAATALCTIMAEHEMRGEMGCFDAATLEWWKDHKARDKARLLRDVNDCRPADLQAYLDKLSAYERSLLSLPT